MEGILEKSTGDFSYIQRMIDTMNTRPFGLLLDRAETTNCLYVDHAVSCL